MGCCCSRPVDDEEDEVKAAKANLAQEGNGSYGAITRNEEKPNINETQFKNQLKADNAVIKKAGTPVSSPKKEKVKRVRSSASTEASPLLETPPTGFERLSPKHGKGSQKSSPAGTPKESPFSSPKSSPKGSPKLTPRKSPKGSPKPSPKKSPKKSPKNLSPAKEPLSIPTSNSNSSIGRPDSKDYSKLEEEVALAEEPISPTAVSPPSPSKPKLLDLAKLAMHTSKWDTGKSDQASGGDIVDEEREGDDYQQREDDKSSSESEEDNEAMSSFDQTPICQSGDEMTPRVVSTDLYTFEEKKPLESSKPGDTPASTSTLERKHKAKDAMKKTSKTMKDAGKKAGEKLGKMFKLGGGKNSPKPSPKMAKKQMQSDVKEKSGIAEAQKSKGTTVTFSSSTKAKGSPVTKKKDTNPHDGDSASRHGNIAGKSRMSERMRSTYARERMEKLEARKQKAGRTQSGGFVDPRKAAHERGQKLGELDDVTEDMKNSAAGFAAMARQLRLQSEREAKS